MLKELSIQNIVLIERLNLKMEGGLTALTGETGAGKSILLDAIGLAVGAKGDKGLVRHKAKEGVVAATFDVGASHPVWSLLSEAGLCADDDLVTLRRVQAADGRTRAFINDQACSVGLLKAAGHTLIEVHGQHQSVGLLDSASHLHVLDAFAGHTSLLRRLSKAHAGWLEAAKALAGHLERVEAAKREEDYLRHVVDELEGLAPSADEEATLAMRRAVLMAAEKVSDELRDALGILEDDRHSARLSSVAGQVEKAASRLPEDRAAPLTEAVLRLDAALEEFASAKVAVMSAADSFVHDPDELNAVEERLFALRAAGRKHSCPPDSLLDYLSSVREQLAGVEQAVGLEAQMRRKVDILQGEFLDLAAEVTASRARAAKRLRRAVTKELKPLKLTDATFEIRLSKLEKGNMLGMDDVGFYLSTNAGVPLAPLGTVASGGELSRIVLALKAALAAVQGKSVVVFDEVDSGIGGAVADAVGERLQRIADRSQVLIVTHSPQVAARADLHWRVEKNPKSKSVMTSVSVLTASERIEELARMLSGSTVTNLARQAAKSLLAPAEKCSQNSQTVAKAAA